MLIKSALTIIFAALLLVAPAAQAVGLTFDEPALSLQHGTVVSTQYNNSLYGNATISAEDLHNTIDLAVAFDSNTPRADTTDDDLLASFSSLLNDTSGDISPGNLSIIQENDRVVASNSGCAVGICDDPDDEGTRIVVPLPASAWLFGTALIGFVGYSRRRII